MHVADDLVVPTDGGLYCPAGGFYVDPWRAVDRAVITHAHSDHARAGSARYLCSVEGEAVLRARLGEATVEAIPYGRRIEINGVGVSLHPAGHVLGSAQVRVEHRGQVCVVSGDYKTQPDATCQAFEPVKCNTFITESTFGLPIYRWRSQAEVFNQINDWWRANQALGRASVVFAYALGKAQRVLAGVDATIGPIVVHGAVARFVELYRQAGRPQPPVQTIHEGDAKAWRGRALVVAPQSAMDSPWLKRFGPVSTALVSGWMRVRGARRWRAMDRGFVLSDHVDWPALLEAIQATGATRAGVTHGYTGPTVRWLREQGLDAYAIQTRFEGESVPGPRASESEADA